jgi:tetratricopeptide (TPR) repeat protein
MRFYPLAVALAAACARSSAPPPLAPAATPADIPTLEEEARQRPGAAPIRLRLAAAYLAAGRCEAAVQQAREGLQLAEDNVLGPLVIGGCQEREGRYDLAAETYTSFADRHPRARGAAALRAKSHTAIRQGAVLAARQALDREAELTTLAPEPRTLAVLPMTVVGDTTYHALSRGLAELLITDLAVIRSFRILERMQIGALLEELRLAQQDRVEPATAARMGRLLRAERMVQGVAAITSDRAPVRLQLTVVGADGTAVPGEEVSGRFRDLLDLEKQLVVGLGRQLGVEITEAERQRILRQGPRNLAAFLAYSHGLEAFDRGDYAAAARHFAEAVSADPTFTAAQQARQAALAAPVVQGATGGEVEAVVETVAEVSARAQPVSDRAVTSSSTDVAGSLGDAVSQQAGGNPTQAVDRQVTTEALGISNLQGASAIIRIIFRRPL